MSKITSKQGYHVIMRLRLKGSMSKRSSTSASRPSIDFLMSVYPNATYIFSAMLISPNMSISMQAALPQQLTEIPRQALLLLPAADVSLLIAWCQSAEAWLQAFWKIRYQKQVPVSQRPSFHGSCGASSSTSLYLHHCYCTIALLEGRCSDIRQSDVSSVRAWAWISLKILCPLWSLLCVIMGYDRIQVFANSETF